MQGVVFVDAEIGRVLRKRCAALERRHVLGCSGGFAAGDRVYLVTRTRDGSQYVLATGVSCVDAAMLGTGDGSLVVVREQDMQLQWPTTRTQR